MFLLAFGATVNAQVSVQLKLDVTGDDVFVYWIGENQADVEQYILHRSTNGRIFVPVTAQNGNGASDATYTYNDLDLANAYYAYRMKVIYSDGTEELLGYEIVNVNVRPVFGNTPHFPDALVSQPINY